MNITVIGKGNVGGGLADRWEKAGHTLTRLGREGGDASEADAVLVAVVGLIPVAYTLGTTFKSAARKPLESVLHWERW